MIATCGACGDPDADFWIQDDPEPDEDGPQDEPEGCGCPEIAGVRLGWWILALLVLMLLTRRCR